MEKLKVGLSQWTEMEVAFHLLLKSLDIIDESAKYSDFKSIYWSNNRMSNHLNGLIDELVRMGYLLHDQEEQMVKVNPDFDFQSTA